MEGGVVPIVQIIYGSERGRAEELSNFLGRALLAENILSQIHAFDEFRITELPRTEIAVFIISTTGYGREPSNMSKSWEFLLRKELEKDSLHYLRFGVFGLGDSSYREFNMGGVKLFNRLEDLGGECLLEIGMGDDHTHFGYEELFDPWIEALVHALFNTKLWVGRQVNTHNTQSKYLVNTHNRYLVQILDQDVGMGGDEGLPIPVGAEPSESPILCEVTHNESPIGDMGAIEDIRDMHINIPSPDPLPYFNHILHIQPKNHPHIIHNFLNLLHLKESAYVRISLNKLHPNYLQNENSPYPNLIRVRQLFESWLNIQGLPHRDWIRVLAQGCPQGIYKEKLLEIGGSTQQGLNEYYTYVRNQYRNYLDVWQEFPMSKLTLSAILEYIPIMRPRQYSVIHDTISPHTQHLYSHVQYIYIYRI